MGSGRCDVWSDSTVSRICSRHRHGAWLLRGLRYAPSPNFSGELLEVIRTTSGLVVMGGVVVCLLGIAINGIAGVAKEHEVPESEKKATVKEFSFKKGVWVATFCGIMSACMSYGFAAGKPIAEVAVAHGSSDLWKNLRFSSLF